MEAEAKEASFKVGGYNAQGCAIAGVLYGFVMLSLVLGMQGAGHGPGFFALLAVYPALSPFGFGLLFWPIIGAMSPFFELKVFKRFTLVLLSLNYAGIAHVIFLYGGSAEVKEGWDEFPGLVSFILIFYLSGQVWIWRQIMKKRTGYSSVAE